MTQKEERREGRRDEEIEREGDRKIKRWRKKENEKGQGTERKEGKNLPGH